jgi:hypothetical protein
MGFRGVNDFITLAKSATTPGKNYNDPYAEFERLAIEYKQGIKHYDRMVYMIKAALQFDRILVPQLVKDYTDYVSALDATKRYSKENIEFWSMFMLSSKDREFQFFYKDEKLIDKVMKQPGYAAREVDKTIFSEIVLPFLETQNTNPNVQFGGMGMYTPGMAVDYAEADWKKLEKIIRQKYNLAVTERNVLRAKKEWYQRHDDKAGAARVYLTLINKFGLIEEPQDPLYMELNYKAYESFLLITDLKIIKGYLPWMKKFVNKFPEYYLGLDTYANLLYKAGKKNEAIIWQGKAANMSLVKGAPDAEEYKQQLEHMKKGQPTYPGKANWEGIKWVKWESVKFQKVLRIKNSAGEVLSGVSIIINGKGQIILTDDKGYAAIEGSVGNIINISKNGFISQEIVFDKTPSSYEAVPPPLTLVLKLINY